ncbi:lanthionine synthetase LanC family protein [Paenibacillus macerans]|uniref:lanthionine synthetase LanC family protein n=1 Tax=Paenibacillus macerans TaxID=44252 RepID=UPI00204138C0|nr:lanthionine synthetase LanC family protein [Paenibacillus macerans]MCM3699008.1 hypothetical protein [Paenibacillus macerans]
MTWFKEKEIASITSEDDRYRLFTILNSFFVHITQEETTFAAAVANNMLIGAGYSILENSEFWDEILMRNMQIIREEISRNKLGREAFPDPALIDTAYSVYFVWKNTKYFGKFVNSFNGYIEDVTSNYIQYFYENKQNLGYGFFSLFSGLSGICNYLLEFGDEYQTMIEELLRIFVYITNEESAGSSRIMNQVDLTNNSLDFSLSNGIGGILMVMVKAYTNNIVVPEQEQAMNQIIRTYRRYVIRRNNSTYWPGILHFGSQNDFQESGNMKETWAYGALAISRVLHAAGNSIHNADIVEWTNQIMLSKGRMPSNEFIVMTPSLSNGYSGLLSLFDAVYRDDPSIVFYKAKNNLLKKIMEFYTDKPEPTFKLKEIILASDRITEVVTLGNNTISHGNIGILLSLVSAFSTATPLFYRYIGIS